MATSPDPVADAAALRAEHDALAERLRVRHTVDELRKAAYAGFAAVVSFGLTAKFAWDRWGWGKIKPRIRGRYPLLFAAALVLFLALAILAVRAWRRAQAHRREEEPMYARFRELRRTLRLDP